jgi:hypothetical protein
VQHHLSRLEPAAGVANIFGHRRAPQELHAAHLGPALTDQLRPRKAFKLALQITIMD